MKKFYNEREPGALLLRKAMPCPLSSELGNASVESANNVFCAFLRVGKLFYL